jgi:hypothetical protein
MRGGDFPEIIDTSATLKVREGKVWIEENQPLQRTEGCGR